MARLPLTNKSQWQRTAPKKKEKELRNLHFMFVSRLRSFRADNLRNPRGLHDSSSSNLETLLMEIITQVLQLQRQESILNDAQPYICPSEVQTFTFEAEKVSSLRRDFERHDIRGRLPSVSYFQNTALRYPVDESCSNITAFTA